MADPVLEHSTFGAAMVAAAYLVAQWLADRWHLAAEIMDDLPSLPQAGGLGALAGVVFWAHRTQKATQAAAFEVKSKAQEDAHAMRERAQEEAWRRKDEVRDEIETALLAENARLRAQNAALQAASHPQINVVVPPGSATDPDPDVPQQGDTP